MDDVKKKKESIENGDYPEWEFGMQIVEEEDEHNFDFDLFGPTKLIPEELVPVQRVVKLTLNRNPDNFFAETEQVAFHPGHLAPGIDFRTRRSVSFTSRYRATRVADATSACAHRRVY